MDPKEEREKQAAEKISPEDYAAEKFAPAKCIACNGRGRSLYGRFPTLLPCHVCDGSGTRQ